MRVTLEPVHEAGERVEVSRFPFRIGRSTDCDLRISDRLVSRRHCELTVEGDSVVVRDLQSRNGTLLNGQAVRHGKVADGSVLTIGLHSFRLRIRRPLFQSFFRHRPAKAPSHVFRDDGSSVVRNGVAV